jgi:hypothetical protein
MPWGETFANSITKVERSPSSGLVYSADTSDGGKITVNDALIKKDGSVVKFNPEDNILAFKGAGPRGNTNITINVSGTGDPERVAELILKKINSKVGMAW